ncbi:hypothetical protein SCMU_22840 [Sinomonas cyclohexanicum]|uniref:Uncharacterized protein n=1 Tax=Sinomonas cyclohexanicum TaxID=322009 RepID=A0ABM7PVY8_SINCY|nr:hypothetical protein [Corynebacterium cyclohexanicum]BCT76442.1 hypothetical protein SCMU_22840 [Corynebacterium cyclohexanicum]
MTKNPRRSGSVKPREPRRIVVEGAQRERPDLRKLSRAVIALAQAEAEREAQAQHQDERPRRPRKSTDRE